MPEALAVLPEALAGWTRARGEPTLVCMSEDQDDDKALALVVRLLRAEKRRTASGAPANLTLLRALVEAARCYAERNRNSARASQELVDRVVTRALGLLHDAPAARWTVASLAKKVGTSRAVLARRFRATTGLSPRRYLSRLRMERATELLLTSDVSLAEIAREVGYDSEFSFNRAFKRNRGLPPGVFRRSAANDRGRILALAA
jgi:transcriptional regulator GlxA family with amidase domain